ncbi:MAG: condensation domain-containing protein, partial [Acidimicrobiales bacterium]
MAATTKTVDARRRWRIRRPSESASIPAMSPEARDTTDRDRCNLTNGQLAMWMGQHLAPELSCFDNPLTFVISGELDVERFAAAFQALVDRSDAMRTVIEEVGRVPVQRVLPQLRYDVPIVRLGGSPDPHRALGDWAADRASRPSNLEERPFDAALVELGPTDTALYLNLHHAVFDGLSCALIYERLSELYVHALAGTLDEAPDMAAYADYVAQ